MGVIRDGSKCMGDPDRDYRLSGTPIFFKKKRANELLKYFQVVIVYLGGGIGVRWWFLVPTVFTNSPQPLILSSFGHWKLSYVVRYRVERLVLKIPELYFLKECSYQEFLIETDPVDKKQTLIQNSQLWILWKKGQLSIQFPQQSFPLQKYVLSRKCAFLGTIFLHDEKHF